MYLVTFRNSNDKLVCMFTEKYKTADDAKRAIEFDASGFLNAHRYDGDKTGTRLRQSGRWMKPKTLDYFEAKAQDGTSCIYQYFMA